MQRDNPDPKGISRRALVRTTAWSVPIVATAATAPAFAASMWQLGGVISYSPFQYTATLNFQPGGPATTVALTFTLASATWNAGPPSSPALWPGVRTSSTVLTYTYGGTLSPSSAVFTPSRQFDFSNTLTVRLLIDGVQAGSALTYAYN